MGAHHRIPREVFSPFSASSWWPISRKVLRFADCHFMLERKNATMTSTAVSNGYVPDNFLCIRLEVPSVWCLGLCLYQSQLGNEFV